MNKLQITANTLTTISLKNLPCSFLHQVIFLHLLKDGIFNVKRHGHLTGQLPFYHPTTIVKALEDNKKTDPNWGKSHTGSVAVSFLHRPLL